VVRTAVTVYFRHVHIPAQSKPNPLRVGSSASRWATSWSLYTANAIHVVWAEYCRNFADDVDAADPTGGINVNRENITGLAQLEVGDPLPRRALYRMTFRFEALADLTTDAARQTLEEAGFAVEDFLADDYGACPALAQLGVSLGWQALRAPSAAWRAGDGFCIAVFEPGREALLRFRELARGARPTIAVAASTTYRAGERPRWLTP
jgi:hypothetical protein